MVATPPSSTDNTPLIAGAVVGSLLFLAVVGALVFLLKRRRARKPPAEKPAAAEMKPQPQSNYAAINVAPLREYNDGRIDLDSDSTSPADQAEQAQNSEYTTVLPRASELYRV
jgi:hypothetical protein